MGEYLSTPIRDKKTEEAENGKVPTLTLKNAQIRYGISGMQGWRRTMEDAHISNLDIGDGVSIFGVFDGHGGTSLYGLILLKGAKSLSMWRSTSSRS